MMAAATIRKMRFRDPRRREVATANSIGLRQVAHQVLKSWLMWLLYPISASSQLVRI